MKLDALRELSDTLGRMDLSLDPGASEVARQIAVGLERFILDNRSPTPVSITQDAIDAARYRKLRARHCSGSRLAHVMAGQQPAPAAVDSFNAFIDALPS